MAVPDETLARKLAAHGVDVLVVGGSHSDFVSMPESTLDALLRGRTMTATRPLPFDDRAAERARWNARVEEQKRFKRDMKQK